MTWGYPNDLGNPNSWNMLYYHRWFDKPISFGGQLFSVVWICMIFFIISWIMMFIVRRWCLNNASMNWRASPQLRPTSGSIFNPKLFGFESLVPIHVQYSYYSLEIPDFSKHSSRFCGCANSMGSIWSEAFSMGFLAGSTFFRVLFPKKFRLMS